MKVNNIFICIGSFRTCELQAFFRFTCFSMEKRKKNSFSDCDWPVCIAASVEILWTFSFTFFFESCVRSLWHRAYLCICCVCGFLCLPFAWALNHRITLRNNYVVWNCLFFLFFSLRILWIVLDPFFLYAKRSLFSIVCVHSTHLVYVYTMLIATANWIPILKDNQKLHS